VIFVDLNQNQPASQQKGFRIKVTMVPATSPCPAVNDPMIATIPVMIDAENAQDAYFPNGGREFCEVAAIVASVGLAC
jgi:hypothetical protein